MNDAVGTLNLPPRDSGLYPDGPELHLQAVSTRLGAELVPELLDAVDRASGWVLHRQMVSASMLQMRIETQGRSLVDLYASLLEQGLELSRDSHLALSERCSCAHFHRQARSSIITLQLEVALPAEQPLLGPWWQGRAA